MTNSTGALTLNVGSGNNTFAGSIAGAGGFTKIGNGSVTLTGTSTYSGATAISAGLLTVNGTSTSSAIAVTSTGTLGGSGSVGAVTVESGGTIAPGNSPGTLTVASSIWNNGGNYNWQLYNATGAVGVDYDTISSSGNLDLSNLVEASRFNINLWTLSGTNASGGSAINFDANGSFSWTLGTFNSIRGFNADNFTINTSATNGTSGFNNSFMAGGFKISTNGTGQLLLTYQGASPVWTGGSGNLSTINTTNGSALVFTGAAGNVTNNAQVSSLSSIAFSNGATGSFNFSGSALTNGSGGIVNNSTYTQTVSLPLTLGADQSFNAASGNLAISGNVANNGNTLTIAGASNTTVDGNISGNGGLTKADAGTATLSGNNTYSGTTTVNGGTLAAGSSTAFGSGALTVNNGSTLALGANNASVGAVTLNSGSITGSGTLTGSSYTVSSGTIAPTLAGAGVTLTKTGIGSVTLNAAETFTGKTTISAGTLILASGASLASTEINLGTSGSKGTLDASALSGGGITIGNGQTLAGYGTVVGNTTIASGATLAPGNSPGVIGITGNLTLNSGSTSIFEVKGLGGAGAVDGFDQVNVSGALTYGGVLKLDVIGSYNMGTAFQDYLFNFGSETGGFSSVKYRLNGSSWSDLNYYAANNTWQMWDNSGLAARTDNGYIGINLNTGMLTVVPEPSTWALVVGGVSTLVILRRRKQS